MSSALSWLSASTRPSSPTSVMRSESDDASLSTASWAETSLFASITEPALAIDSRLWFCWSSSTWSMGVSSENPQNIASMRAMTM